jgi:hypothetical protein
MKHFIESKGFVQEKGGTEGRFEVKAIGDYASGLN